MRLNSILTLTTTGTGGASTLVGNTLNVPQYQVAGTYVTSLTVTTNQGVSGSFTAGATPALTLTLGALTGVTSFNGLVVTANTGVITTGVWQGTSISTTYTDAKIKGSIANTQVAYGSAADTISGSSLFTWSGTILKLGSTAFTSSLSGGIVQIEGTDVYYSAQSTNILGSSGFRFGQNNSIYGTLQSQGSSVSGNWTGTSVARTSATELIAGGTSGANNMILAAANIYGLIGTTATNFGYKLDANGFRIDQIQNLHTANATGVTFGSVGTNGINFQGLIGTTTSSAMYMNQATPSATNFALSSTASGSTLINGAAVILQLSGSSKLTVNSFGVLFDPGQGIAGTSILRFTTSNNSNQTAGTNVPKMLYTIGTTSWATGALAAADFVQYTQPSILFTGASTATLAASFAINGAVIASTNATVTTSVGLLVKAGTSLGAATTNGYGAYFNSPTGATNNYALGVSGSLQMIGRVLQAQGADVASANNLSLGTDGNTFEITGTTQVNLISNVGWQNGSKVTLLFTSTPTVKHNQATSTTDITIQLAGAADFAATAGDTLTLVLSEIGGTQAWREISRAVI